MGCAVVAISAAAQTGNAAGTAHGADSDCFRLFLPLKEGGSEKQEETTVDFRNRRSHVKQLVGSLAAERCTAMSLARCLENHCLLSQRAVTSHKAIAPSSGNRLTFGTKLRYLPQSKSPSSSGFLFP